MSTMHDILRMKDLASAKYPEMNWTNKRQILSFTARENTPNKNEDTKPLSGEILFCWPLTWLENLEKWEPLAQRLAHDAAKRIQLRIHDFDPKLISSDLVYFPLFSTPLAWREEGLNSELSNGYKKLLLWITWCVAFFIVDDMTESWYKNKDHADLVRSYGRLLYEIVMSKFRSTDEIRENLNFQLSTKGNEDLKGFAFVHFDLVNEMKSFLEVTPVLLSPSRTVFRHSKDAIEKEDPSSSPFLHVARCSRYGSELQTWVGCSEYSQFLKKDLRHELRSIVVGFDICYEFFILLDGLLVPEMVRNNFYWNKLIRDTRKIGYMINDIVSVKKELLELERTGRRQDNGILVSMEIDRLSCEDALKKHIEELNELLEDYRRECKFALENDGVKFELSEEEKIIFDLSLKAMPIPISALFQTSFRMPRYLLDNIQVVFTDLDPFNE